ncbi:protein eyes shut homolog isoform X2 [Crotalus tigris]|nr:protein eyes shut homolog isoform X2 [Crotalus tigris]
MVLPMQKKEQQLQQVLIGRNPFCPQEPGYQSRLCDLKTMKLKPLLVTIACCLLQSSMVGGQTLCNRSLVSEWKAQPTVHTVKWSLSQNICSSFFTECWNIDSYPDSSTADNVPLRLTQICPLQLQLGDLLFVSSEPSFQSHGMNLANVSWEEFIQCPQPRDGHRHQLLFDHGLSRMHQIVPKWLGIGTHYFAEVPIRGPLLCHFGLRLNVTVKPHACQKFSNSTFCSDHGKCLSHIWDEAYHCHCNYPYSGQFCQEIDKCSSKPCYNHGICIRRKSQRKDVEDSHECICPPSFTGPFCEEPVKPCSSQPCQNEAVCHNNPSGYSCACPPGFLGPDCETDINECFSGPCQNGGICHDRPNDVSCTCLPMFTGKFCEKMVTTLCEPSPCLNNGSCIDEVESYHCSCMPGYTGRNCEEVIDYCRLLSISCLNEGLCLNIIGGFSCLCAPGWTGQFCQFVENPCLIYPANCHPGATCVDISQSKLQPQTKCLCLPGFTGTFCETEINECDSNPCKNGGSCRDDVGHYKCICPLGFQGQQCEINLDPCLFHNITCNSGTQRVDKPYKLAYRCRTACQENSELCMNGRGFHDEDNQNYLCVCVPGWTGPTCLESNVCEMSWCQNGAICKDGINEHR